MGNSLTPTAKVGQVPVTGAAAIFIIWLLAQFGVDLPAEVAAAFVIIVVFVVGYIIKDRRTPDPDTDIEPVEDVANDHAGIVPGAEIDIIDYLSGYAAAAGGYVTTELRPKRSFSWELGYANAAKFKADEDAAKRAAMSFDDIITADEDPDDSGPRHAA